MRQNKKLQNQTKKKQSKIYIYFFKYGVLLDIFISIMVKNRSLVHNIRDSQAGLKLL